MAIDTDNTTDLAQEQYKKYKNLRFVIAIKKERKALLEHFIASEKQAVAQGFKGVFFELFHYEITKIVRSKMLGIPEQVILETYYYRLLLGIWDTLQQERFSLYKKAIYHALKKGGRNISRSSSYILLKAYPENLTQQNLAFITYTEYYQLLQFVHLCSSYVSYENMLAKKSRFLKFLTNKELLERAQKIIRDLNLTITADIMSMGCLLIVGLDTQDTSKKTITWLLENKQIHPSILKVIKG